MLGAGQRERGQGRDRRPSVAPAVAAGVVRPAVSFRAYWLTVVVAGTALVADAAERTPPSRWIGHHPLAFCLFTLALLAAELKPLTLLIRDGGGEFTVSWIFSFALLFLAGPAGAGVAAFGTTAIADLIRRKPLDRIAFNASQLTVCLFAAATAVSAVDGRGPVLSSGPGASARWLVAAATGAAVAFLLNSVITTVVVALAAREPVIASVRSGIFVNLSTDGTLLALSPVLAVVAVHSLLLLPLLLSAAWAVYHSTRMALARKYEADHDPLTGLANRRAFDAALGSAQAAAARWKTRIAVVLVDLDGFKAINDRLGHQVGDLVLKEVSARLSDACRPGDLAARLGGDEFAVLLRVDDADSALALANKVMRRLHAPYTVSGFPVAIGASFGLAVYPDHGDSVDQLLDQADVAMYRAKRQRGGVTLPERRTDMDVGRLALLSELNGSFDQDQLVLHYQPKIHLRTGQLAGVEALVRWAHPRFGLLLPDVFIPLAEQTELMVPFTEHVLRQGLRQCAAWTRAGLTVPIAVNGSARNLHDLGFPDVVARLLAQEGVAPGLLELEITENTVMTDPVRAGSVLKGLRDLGVGVSIDDFGTGYSSLASLRDLPVDRIKVDKSFVMGMADRPGDAVIVRSILELARNLGLDTVAEGVEDASAMEWLTEAGCDLAQGYLISRPLPEELLTPWLVDASARQRAGGRLLDHHGTPIGMEAA